MSTQQGDVLLFQTLNDGDINVELGIVEMSGGLETMAYICLFGGNFQDDGRPNNEFTYWGNRDEVDSTFKYVSETQNLLSSIPATSSNLRRIEEAALRDLQTFIDIAAASSVNVEVSIPALNRVNIVIDIDAEGEESQFEFSENWVVNI